jgi:uncharacterized protein (TIGR02246 family)
MMPVEPWSITAQFNEAINARDLDGLAALMTDDHRFVDTEAHAVIGKDACLESWRGFFEQFPDYRNVFTTQIPRDNVVLVVGYSTCSFEPLDGPAVWRAIVRDNKVAEWRVYEDTQTTRHTLGIT